MPSSRSAVARLTVGPLAVLLLAVGLASSGCSGASGEASGCRRAEDCGSREYCSRALGGCDAPGACAPRPEVCMERYAPVCGCDGETYGNACRAAARGAAVRRAEACP